MDRLKVARTPPSTGLVLRKFKAGRHSTYRPERGRRSVSDAVRFSAWNRNAGGIQPYIRHPYICTAPAGNGRIRGWVRAPAVRAGSPREARYSRARTGHVVTRHSGTGEISECLLQALGLGNRGRLG